MKCGFKTIDITPPSGTPMGGNCRTDNISKGAHDALYADIIAFESKSGNIVLIDLDWCEAPLDVISSIKEKIVQKTGLEYGKICITMTHTHSSPDVYGCFSKEGIPELSVKYIRDIAVRLAEAVREAMRSMDVVLTGTAKCSVDNLSFNRRFFFRDGSLHMNWEILENNSISPDQLDKPEGPVDTDLYVIKFCSEDGRLKAVLVNYTMHPAILVMEDMLFSKDYIWGMEKELRKAYGEDVLIYFANGAEGNINHINMWDKTQKRSWPEAERIGKALACSVRRLTDSIQVKEEGSPGMVFDRIDIPVRQIDGKMEEEARRLWEKCGSTIPGLTDGVPDEWYAWSILKLAENTNRTRPVELQAIMLGDVVIATLPGEMFVEFGLKLKQDSPFENTLLFGLANQSAGYIPTERAFKNGGYEPRTCEFSLLVPEAGQMITGRLLELINRLRK